MNRFSLIGLYLVLLLGTWTALQMGWNQGPQNPAWLRDSGLTPPRDTAFALELDDCRCCHGSVVDRHHLLAESKIKQCQDCHEVTFDEESGTYSTQVIRDCLVCHEVSAPLKDRHHITVEQGQQGCLSCHDVFLDEQTQTYFINLSRPCSASSPDTSVNHYSVHTVPPSDCNGCHMKNLFDQHSEQCHLCHQSESPNVQTAIQNQDTRCTACHSQTPHSLTCRICHDSTRSYTPSQKPQIHLLHSSKVSCGVCHRIPETTILERTGQYCTLCHPIPRSYTASQLPMIHRTHIWNGDYSPYSCYICHGQSVPQRETSQCFPCHDDKRYQRSTLKQIHDAHNRRFDCSNCHYNPRLFDLSVMTPCFRCHEPRTYASGFQLHSLHQGRQCWSCHSSKDVSARAGFTCVSCHGTAKAYTSPTQVHQSHNATGFQCWVCHEELVPMYVSASPSFNGQRNGTIQGNVQDSLGRPLEGAAVVATPAGYLAVTAADGGYSLFVVSDLLYSVTAYRSGYENLRKQVQVASGQTAQLDFTLRLLVDGTDTDSDGLTDEIESRIGTDPAKQDTDGDGITDYDEVNYDGDRTAFNPETDLNPLAADTDGDGFVDGRDGKISRTDYPAGMDLDGDGFVDGEMDVGTNPLSAASYYGDGDMNEDGVTDLGDVLLAHRLVLGLATPSVSDYVHGNTAPAGRPDGAINIADVLMIQSKTMP